jgi:hypothetical protein
MLRKLTAKTSEERDQRTKWEQGALVNTLGKLQRNVILSLNKRTNGLTLFQSQLWFNHTWVSKGQDKRRNHMNIFFTVWKSISTVCMKSIKWYFSRRPLWCLIINLYKTFWEELIAYFPWYYKDRIENGASNNSSIVGCVFVTAVTFLRSRFLATIGGILPNRAVT